MKLLFVEAAALMASIPAFASQELAQKNGCLASHGVDKKILGPSFEDVA
jgi:cytochrome c